jgi:hypothetical protein
LFDVKNALSRSGNATLKVDVVTEYRSFSYWVMRHPKHPASVRETNEFAALGGVRPKTITYKLNPQTNFYNVLGYNGPADAPPE